MSELLVEALFVPDVDVHVRLGQVARADAQATALAAVEQGRPQWVFHRADPLGRLLAREAPGAAIDATRIAALQAEERAAVAALDALWAALRGAKRAPVTFAVDEWARRDEAAAVEALQALLHAGGLRVPDAAALADLHRRVRATQAPGGVPLVASAALRKAFERVPAFVPTPVLASLTARREAGLPAWILRASVDGDRPPAVRGRPVEVTGVLVLGADAPAGLSLVQRCGAAVEPVTWNLPSPRFAQEHPGSPNGARARFRATLADRGEPVQLVLEGAGDPLPVLQVERVRPAADAVLARVEEIPQSPLKLRGEYEALRLELDAIAPPVRDRRWREASVLLDVSATANAEHAFKTLQRLRADCATAEDVARFEAFFDKAAALMHPSTLGPHGYRRALASVDAGSVWSGIRELSERIAALGGPCFINSGTLLGAIRDGRLIAHDDDVDLAVVLAGDSLPAVVERWVALKDRLREAGLLDVNFDARVRSHCKVGKAGGVSVDLFPAWVVGGKLSVWPYTLDTLPADAALPLATLELAGTVVHVPRRPEALLAENYGDGWRVRDPAFRFDWTLAQRRFADFLRLVKGSPAP